MREQADLVSRAFPRPGRTLWGILIVLAVFAVADAIFTNWGPKSVGELINTYLTFDPAHAFARPWTFFTSGVITAPSDFTHILFSLVGLYFLTPELEKTWGGARLVRFLLLSVAVGNALTLAWSHVHVGPNLLPSNGLTPGFGPIAAITATALAWAKENSRSQIRFLMFLPMSGRTLFWLTVVLAGLAPVFVQSMPEGPLAPLGGVATGIVFAGTPSLARAAWLRVKLFVLRRRGGTLDVDRDRGLESERALRAKPAKRSRKGDAPPLRVVYGGLEEDLKNRKPPKDKRYLN